MRGRAVKVGGMILFDCGDISSSVDTDALTCDNNNDGTVITVSDPVCGGSRDLNGIADSRRHRQHLSFYCRAATCCIFTFDGNSLDESTTHVVVDVCQVCSVAASLSACQSRTTGKIGIKHGSILLVVVLTCWIYNLIHAPWDCNC